MTALGFGWVEIDSNESPYEWVSLDSDLRVSISEYPIEEEGRQQWRAYLHDSRDMVHALGDFPDEEAALKAAALVREATGPTLSVLPPEAPEPPPPPARNVDVKTWEERMTTYGEMHGKKCVERLAAGTLTTDQAVIYGIYDGIRVMQMIGEYHKGAGAWRSYTEAYITAYRDKYGAANKYGLPSYYAFVWGLYHDAAAGSAASKVAVFELAEKASYAHDAAALGDLVTQKGSREVAHLIMILIASAKLGGRDRTPKLTKLVDMAVEHAKEWISGRAAYMRPFMVGITCHAFRDYYEYNEADAKKRQLPEFADELLSLCWSKCWDEAALTFRYTDRIVTGQSDLNPTPDLNNYLAAVAGWLFKLTGEKVYTERGDKMFNGSAKGYALGEKQFNQIYRYSFSYLKDTGISK